MGKISNFSIFLLLVIMDTYLVIKLNKMIKSNKF